MSKNAAFFRGLCSIAHSNAPEEVKRASLERISAKAEDMCAMLKAERLIMEGWKHEDKRAGSG